MDRECMHVFRILFLPLLNIPSGHHHVADVLVRQLEKSDPGIQCKKVDPLSFSYGKVESVVSSVYLYWIHHFPNLYSSLYKFTAVKNSKKAKRFVTYELLFLTKMKRLIQEVQPHAVVCTHAFPSYLLSRLKQMALWDGLAINVYTDYFVNSIWGREGIDYHFVPSIQMKNHLASRGISQRQIFITGIPVDPVFHLQTQNKKRGDRRVVLISGGNMGAGSIRRFIARLRPSGHIQYKILCGMNETLYQFVQQLNHPNIEPLPYIEKKEDMNRLYEDADAIITKPGGVTISECLIKNLPIFVYDALPGQEEQNLQFLKKEGLVHHLGNWDKAGNPEEDILRLLKNIKSNLQLKTALYSSQIELADPHSFIIHHLKKTKRV